LLFSSKHPARVPLTQALGPMSDSDLLSLQDVYDATAAVHRIYRRVMTVVVASNLLLGLLITFLLLAFASMPYPLAAALGTALALVGGISSSLHWVRHYRAIFNQLAAVEARLVQGETLLGSEIQFHSYR
jgi:hypothetical protein